MLDFFCVGTEQARTNFFLRISETFSKNGSRFLWQAASEDMGKYVRKLISAKELNKCKDGHHVHMISWQASMIKFSMMTSTFYIYISKNQFFVFSSCFLVITADFCFSTDVQEMKSLSQENQSWRLKRQKIGDPENTNKNDSFSQGD